MDDTRISDAAVAKSAFFAILPPELRRRVLTIAFGGQTVHVYHPSAHRPDLSPFGSRDGRGRCHGRLCNAGDPSSINPSLDGCLEDTRRQRQVGAVGWLSSCRSAFEEGIDVLYSTNAFHISLETLQPGLLHYLPTYGLSRTKSLRLVLNPRILGVSQPGIRDAVPHAIDREEGLLEALLCSMASTLPNLQELYIGFCGGLGFWNHAPNMPKQRYQNYRDHLLPLLDDVARAFGSRLLELEVGLPMSSFWALFSIGLRAGERFQAPNWKPERFPQGGYHSRQRIRRPVDTNTTLDGQPIRVDSDVGYWISETWADTPDGWMLDNDQYWE